MDTEEELKMPPPTQRITRGILARCLKKYKVSYDPTASRSKLWEIMQANNVPLDPPPPGPIRDNVINISDDEDYDRQIEILQAKKREKEGEFGPLSKDGYPANIGKLRAFCKAKGIKIKPTDRRSDMIAKLNG